MAQEHPTALLVLDLQQAFLSRPYRPVGAFEVLNATLALARDVRTHGGFIVATRTLWSADLIDAPRQRTDKPMPVLTQGQSPDWGLLPAELEDAADLTITKRHWNAFHGTELDLQLRRRRIENLWIAGIATNFAVESTARFGWEAGYSLTFISDALASISDEMHLFSLDNILPRLGRVRQSGVARAELAARQAQAAALNQATEQ